jgi:hypothetical protein
MTIKLIDGTEWSDGDLHAQRAKEWGMTRVAAKARGFMLDYCTPGQSLNALIGRKDLIEKKDEKQTKPK